MRYLHMQQIGTEQNQETSVADDPRLTKIMRDWLPRLVERIGEADRQLVRWQAESAKSDLVLG